MSRMAWRGVAGPLTTYLVGIAVGRGQAPSAALAAVSALLPAEPDQPTDKQQGAAP